MGQTFKKQKQRMSWEPRERAQDPAATVALDTGPPRGLSPAPSRPAVCAGRRARVAVPLWRRSPADPAARLSGSHSHARLSPVCTASACVLLPLPRPDGGRPEERWEPEPPGRSPQAVLDFDSREMEKNEPFENKGGKTLIVRVSDCTLLNVLV